MPEPYFYYCLYIFITLLCKHEIIKYNSMYRGGYIKTKSQGGASYKYLADSSSILQYNSVDTKKTKICFKLFIFSRIFSPKENRPNEKSYCSYKLMNKTGHNFCSNFCIEESGQGISFFVWLFQGK